MPKEAKIPPTLDDAQKEFIEKHWHYDLKTLTQQVFSNPAITLRNVECKAVKMYLGTIGKVAVGLPTEQQPVAAFMVSELTEEQKEYIRNNMAESSGPLEMARVLFKNERLLPTSREYRMVHIYCKQIDSSYHRDDELVDDIDYVPPKSILHLIGKLNKYIPSRSDDGSKALFDYNKLTSTEERNFRSLISYLRIPRFKIEADKYIKRIDRVLFESTFMGFVYDKGDLLAEEVHQYISLASEVVITHQIDKMVQKLDERLNAMLDTGDGTIRMPEVELLNAVREKSNKSKEQQKKLLDNLVEKRSERLQNRLQANASVLNLVEIWKKSADRKRIIELAVKRNDGLRKEVERLSSLDSLRAEVYGLDPTSIGL